MDFCRSIRIPDAFLRAAGKAMGATLLLLSLAVAACAPGPLVRDGAGLSPVQSSRVLLMQPDVEISELTAAGLAEPNAAWTATARANVEQALDAFLAEKGARLIPQGETVNDPQEIQLVKLHEAVGASILVHTYLEQAALPTKPDFDWTLGDEAAVLRRNHGADYALFLNFRDSFSSGGRVAFMVAAAVFGVSVPGGQQTGFASLVDLRTGDVVWFHTMLSSTGDLREPEGARTAVETLLTQIPL